MRTPRWNVCAQLVINEQYSRIPVYTGDIDHMVGFVHVRDMFELGEEERSTMKIRELMRPIRFVPETKPVHDLMREMQHEGAHMVIVVDEYGNTAGLVTMEDLVEVILGEIRDEHEPDSDVTVKRPTAPSWWRARFDLARLQELLKFGPRKRSNRHRGRAGHRMAGPRSDGRRDRWSGTACVSKCWPATNCA